MTTPAALGYTTAEVARLLEVAPERVRSFVRAGVLAPRRGSRREYRFSFQDLVVLRAARELAAQGFSMRRIRRGLTRLAETLPGGRPLAALRISADGDQIVARAGGDAWEPESGQRLLDFEVRELAQRAAPLAHRAAERARDRADLDAESWYEMGYELEPTVPEEAADAYRRALELDAEHPDAHLNLGRLLHEAGRLGAAEEHFRRALDARPGDPTAHFDLGVALQDQERLAEAEAEYRRALDADPRFADAHYNLAGLSERAGREAEAIRHLKAYLRLTRRR